MCDQPKAKRCPRCNQLKRAKDFYRDRARKDGLTSYCKQCADKAVAKSRDKIQPACERACQWCQEYFMASWSKQKRMYCSPECRREAQRALHKPYSGRLAEGFRLLNLDGDNW